MTVVPRRHWRSYGNDPLPTAQEALDEPLRAFPSWFLRIVCDRCGKERMISETYLVHGEMLIRDIIGADASRWHAAVARGRWSCSPASRASVAAPCAALCRGTDTCDLIGRLPGLSYPYPANRSAIAAAALLPGASRPVRRIVLLE